MDSDHIVEVRGLTAGYAGQAVLRDICFDVRRGEIFMILGGSGSGKSTLLKNMIGLYPAMAGKVIIGGEDIVGARGADRERILRKFGVMYQGGALFGSMSLENNVALPLEEGTRLPADARTLLGPLEAATSWSRRIRQLPAFGNQRRYAEARGGGPGHGPGSGAPFSR